MSCPDTAVVRAAWCARLYLWLAVPAMLVLCFLTPPFGGADEPAHFLRSFALGSGQVVPVVNRSDMGINSLNSSAGAMVDPAVADFALQPGELYFADPARKYSIEKMQRDFRRMPAGGLIYARHSNTAIYPPLLYPASTTAVWITVHLGLPILGWLYAGRIANVLVGSILIWWSIRRGRDVAPLLLVAGFLPVMLFGVATISADALLLPLTLVLGTTLARVATRTPLDRADHVMLAISSVMIGVGKIAYMPFVLLPTIAFRLVDGLWSRRATAFAMIGAVGVASWLLWSLSIHDKVFTIRPDMKFTDPQAQLSFLIGNPVAGIRALGGSMLLRIPALAGNMVGTTVGWIDVRLPIAYGVAALAVLTGSALVSADPMPRVKRLLPIALALGAAGYFAVFLLIYLQNTWVGAPFVEGVQGRYMFPLVLPLLCLVPRFRISVDGDRKKWAGIAAVAWCTVSVVVTIVAVLQRHWW